MEGCLEESSVVGQEGVWGGRVFGSRGIAGVKTQKPGGELSGA